MSTRTCGGPRGVCGVGGMAVDIDCEREGTSTLGGAARRALRLGRGGGSLMPNSPMGGGPAAWEGVAPFSASSMWNDVEMGEQAAPVVARRGGRGNEGNLLSSKDELIISKEASSEGAVCERLRVRTRGRCCAGKEEERTFSDDLVMRDSSLGEMMYCPTGFGIGGISSP